jgi:hypothetical protein
VKRHCPLGGTPLGRYAFVVAPFGKLLIIGGLLLAALGVLLMLGDKLGLGKLPGDIVYRGDKVTFHFPIVTSLLLSVVLTVVLNWWFGRR